VCALADDDRQNRTTESVNMKTETKTKTETFIASQVRPAIGCYAPLRIVLHEGGHGYVVHTQNMQTGGFNNGDYFDKNEMEQALACFNERCKSWGVSI